MITKKLEELEGYDPEGNLYDALEDYSMCGHRDLREDGLIAVDEALRLVGMQLEVIEGDIGEVAFRVVPLVAAS